MAWTINRAANCPVITLVSDATPADMNGPVLLMSSWPHGMKAVALDVYPSSNTDTVKVRDRSATGGEMFYWEFDSLNMKSRELYGTSVLPYIKASEQGIDDWTKFRVSVILKTV